MSKRVNNRRGKRGASGKYNKQWYAQRQAERFNGTGLTKKIKPLTWHPR